MIASKVQALYTFNLLFILSVLLITASCSKDKAPRFIPSISSDLIIDDGRLWYINPDTVNITASIYVRGNSTLMMKNSTLIFDLNKFEERGIYLEDNAELEIFGNAILESKNNKWEFELKGNANIEISDSEIKDLHSLFLFDSCSLDGNNSLIEQLDMYGKSTAILDNCTFGNENSNAPNEYEISIFDRAHAYALNCDLTNTDIFISDNGILELTNCTYTPSRVKTLGNGKLIVH